MTKKHSSKLIVVLSIIGIFNNNQLTAQDVDGYMQSNTNHYGTSNIADLNNDIHNVSINYNTGVGNISIPFYSISNGPLSLPISLNYGTQGIKVDQPASDVGLGWNLSAGGNISRVIKVLPDEFHYIKPNATLAEITDNYNTMNLYLEKSYYSAAYSSYTLNVINRINNMTNSCNSSAIVHDSEPDLFSLNIGGKSIDFVFDQNQNPVFLDNSYDIKITLASNSFTVKDENGIKYYFNESDAEKTDAMAPVASTNHDHISGNNYINFNTNRDMLGCTGNSWTGGVITNWKLSKIESPDAKNSINFQYDSYDTWIVSNANLGYNVDPATNNLVTPFVKQPCYTPSPQPPFTIGVYYDLNDLNLHKKRLKKIDWKTGTVIKGYINFESNTQRQDIDDKDVFGNTISFDKSMDFVKIFNDQNVELKRFALNYSYFNSSVATTDPGLQWQNKKLKLNSITEYSSDLIAKPSYIFDYDATAIPIKFSYQQDFWGYYNGNNATTMMGTIYHNSNYSNTATNDYAIWSPFCIYPINFPGSGGTSAYTTINGANRLPNINYTKAGILNKVTYPTGGSLSLDYESNVFRVDWDNTDRLAGGLRLKKTTLYDGVNHTNDIVKNFYYTADAMGNTSSGRINFLPSMGYDLRFIRLDYFAQPQYTYLVDYYRITAYNVATSTTSGESRVYYNEVKVVEPGKGYTKYQYNNYGTFGHNNDLTFSGSPMIVKSKTETASWEYAWIYPPGVANYSFSNNEVLLKNTNYPYFPEPNIEWAVGELKEVDIYDQSANLKFKKVYNYAIKSFDKIKGYLTTPQVNYACVNTRTSSMAIAKYNYLSVWKVLSDETEYTYDALNPTQNLSKITNYEYNSTNHKFITSKLTTNSDGNSYRNEYTYVADCNILSTAIAMDDATLAFRKMKFETHQLKAPTETTTYQIKGGNKYLLGGSLNLYKDFNNTLTNTPNPPSGFIMTETNNSSLINLSEQYTFETSTPILISGSNYMSLGFGYNGFCSCNYSSFDSKYKRKLTYENYDLFGNAIQLKQENGPRASVVYGYDNNLTIASITNASSKDCGFTSFESNDQNLWSIDPAISLITTDGHCGTSSRSIPPNTYGPTRDYVPSTDAQNKKFILSCWVKTNTTLTGNLGSLVLYSMQNSGSGSIYPNVTGAYKAMPVTNTNGVWQYIEVEIDLQQVKITGSLPLSTNLAIRSFLWNTNATAAIQIDDIRFYPKEARMSSYTYKPLIGTSSASDENSNCQYYEYDSFGRLQFVKNQFGQILEKTEYNYKP